MTLRDTMIDPGPGTWIVEINNDETDARVFASAEALRAFIAASRTAAAGQLAGFLDCGPAPWWERFLGGGSRKQNPRFAIEWYGEFASLIFLDDNASEYRVLDHEQPVDPPDAIRLHLAHGELQPHPSEQCMRAVRAWDALNEFIERGVRPAWLTYRYVR